MNNDQRSLTHPPTHPPMRGNRASERPDTVCRLPRMMPKTQVARCISASWGVPGSNGLAVVTWRNVKVLPKFGKRILSDVFVSARADLSSGDRSGGGVCLSGAAAARSLLGICLEGVLKTRFSKWLFESAGAPLFQFRGELPRDAADHENVESLLDGSFSIIPSDGQRTPPA
jgi:hypothetical protein